MMNRNTSIAALACAALLGSAPAGAVQLVYFGTLSGANESPPNASPATGNVTVTIDTTAFTMRVQASFAGLIGNTTAAHIHCCTPGAGSGTAGVATLTPSFTGFPIGVTSGSMDDTYNLLLNSTYNAAFVTANGGGPGAYNALTSGLANGLAYFNVHTSTFGGGEVRAFLAPVPEPASYALLLGGLAVVGAVARRRKHA